MLSEVKAFFTSPIAFAAVAALDAPRGTKTFPLVCNCGCLCGFGRSCEEDDDVVRATGGLWSSLLSGDVGELTSDSFPLIKPLSPIPIVLMP